MSQIFVGCFMKNNMLVNIFVLFEVFCFSVK